ncbi:MAG: GlsB/YeaQ/YmgE family stress response membrane protein [Anaerolineaceae bacterium]|nr:GlsB/YeaQ/YmgE family stress response membrane protein [Anaerolineaceae bacterium]
MGIIAWIVVGGLAGWIASLIMKTNERMGCVLNIIVGIIGAFIGGLVVQLITGTGFDFGFNLTSLIVAVIGAIILLFLVGLIRGRGARPV